MTHQKIRYNRAVLVKMTDQQYEFVLQFASVRHISMSVAVVKMIKLCQIVDAMPADDPRDEKDAVQ